MCADSTWGFCVCLGLGVRRGSDLFFFRSRFTSSLARFSRRAQIYVGICHKSIIDISRTSIDTYPPHTIWCVYICDLWHIHRSRYRPRECEVQRCFASFRRTIAIVLTAFMVARDSWILVCVCVCVFFCALNVMWEWKSNRANRYSIDESADGDGLMCSDEWSADSFTAECVSGIEIGFT